MFNDKYRPYLIGATILLAVFCIAFGYYEFASKGKKVLGIVFMIIGIILCLFLLPKEMTDFFVAVSRY